MRVFGKAAPEEIAEIDRVLGKDLGEIDPEAWK